VRSPSRSRRDGLAAYATVHATGSADTYLGNHPDIAGFPISIPDAIEAGRTVFADLMKEH